MADFCEVRVRISNPDQKYVQNFPCYSAISVSKEDPILAKMVEDALKNFKGEDVEIKVSITYMWD